MTTVISRTDQIFKNPVEIQSHTDRVSKTFIEAVIDKRDVAILEMTRLQYFASKGDWKTMEKLIKKGADIYERFCSGSQHEAEGYTALHFAVANNRLKAALLLLDWGLNPNDKAKNGMTSFQIARENDNQEMLDLFKYSYIEILNYSPLSSISTSI